MGCASPGPQCRRRETAPSRRSHRVGQDAGRRRRRDRRPTARWSVRRRCRRAGRRRSNPAGQLGRLTRTARRRSRPSTPGSGGCACRLRHRRWRPPGLQRCYAIEPANCPEGCSAIRRTKRPGLRPKPARRSIHRRPAPPRLPSSREVANDRERSLAPGRIPKRPSRRRYVPTVRWRRRSFAHAAVTRAPVTTKTPLTPATVNGPGGLSRRCRPLGEERRLGLGRAFAGMSE